MKGKKIRTRDADATRSALMDAARILFAANGYEGTRTQQISDKSGINKAMISYYFGGKKGLYQSLLIEDLQSAQSRLSRAVDGDLPPQERLSQFLKELGVCLAENPFMIRILTREQMSGSKNLEPKVWRQLFQFFQKVREILQQGVESGSFRKIDPHALHLSLVGGLIYYVLTEPARETYARAGDLPSIPAWSEYVDIQKDLFLRALAPENTIRKSKNPRRGKK